MPSTNDDSPPTSSDVRLAATMRRTLAISGAITFLPELQTHTRLPENRYLVQVLYVTCGVLFYMAVRWRYFIIPGAVEPWLDLGSALLFPSTGATLNFAYPEFEWRPAFIELTVFVMVGKVMAAFMGRGPTVSGRLPSMKGFTHLSNPHFESLRRFLKDFITEYSQELSISRSGRGSAERRILGGSYHADCCSQAHAALLCRGSTHPRRRI